MKTMTTAVANCPSSVHAVGGGVDAAVVEVQPRPDSPEDAARAAEAFSAFEVRRPPIRFDSPYVRAVTELAPELEQLVGQLCDSITALSHDERGDYIHRPETDEAGRRQSYARGVLARLDAARKKGRDG